MERNSNQINNYLDLSPRQPGSSSPIAFERAPTPGLSSFTPKPFPTPTTGDNQPTNYSSPTKHYRTNSPQLTSQAPERKTQQQHHHHPPETQEQEQYNQQAAPQEDLHHYQEPSENQNISTSTDLNNRGQRKRRQDDDLSFHEDDQDDSTLSEPPSEPAARVEPQPKRSRVKKPNKRIKQSAKPDLPKPTEFADPEQNLNNDPQPTESVALPPANSVSTEPSKLSKMTFKRKKNPPKRTKTNSTSSKPKTPSTAKPATHRPTAAEAAPTAVSEAQEEMDVTQNEEAPVPSNSNRQSPTDQPTDQHPEPTPSHSDPTKQQQQQQPLNRPELSQDQDVPNPSKPLTTTSKTTSTTTTSLKKPSNASQNPSQTSTKKPVKPSFKKVNKAGTSSSATTTNGFPGSSTTSTTTTPKPSISAPLNPPRKKAGEYDLNDPTTWGALFGAGDKKPAVKPVKPGNLPPQASLSYNGAAVDRLEARKKQRAQEKKTLNQQMKIGFDLLRQNIDMMDFEIEYKNHVRAMIERPLSAEYLPMETNESKNVSSSSGGLTGSAIGLTSSSGGSSSQGENMAGPANVFLRPDGYKRYLNPPLPLPPPPSSSASTTNNNPLPSSQTVPSTLSHQPPGPIYSSSFPPHLPRKTLPRPGMFGSSFFIWQRPHLP
ncbi:hypothetical protein PGTUg99_019699 [Puccinia graminis f. sp. tritici]|uniref:Uncharacterized protein n=1 Tax=Puccinia graminis f. sp. tritici TaxID=56615 RepID=A0A5B0MD55_PUCGR|nr:hypothetical protein PGTUg99_019699 [Puccinia graminis f. sp. tritici]